MNRKRHVLEPIDSQSTYNKKRRNADNNNDALYSQPGPSTQSEPIFQSDDSDNSDIENLPENISENDVGGTVEKIYVRNFMCHEALEMSFNRNVNFVVGRNGSGKSAILTALVVGLGGRASVTNRGNTIKGFIKTGQTSAFVEITLRNDGPCTYEPKAYGRKITVIRSFSSGGASSYKVKSESGKIISHSGREVSRIAEAFNIQVDNPVCILNQDTSRNFLNSNDPKKLYMLYMRAINMEAINEYYKKISMDRWEIRDKIKEKELIFEDRKTDLKKWEKKYQLIQSLDSHANRLEELKRERFWSNYTLLEKERSDVENTLHKIKEKYKHMEQKVNDKSSREKCLRETIQSLERQIEEIRNESKGLEQQFREQKNKYSVLQESYSVKEGNLQNKRLALARKKKDYNNLNDQINELNKSAESALRQRQAYAEQVEKVEEELASITAQFTTSEHELMQIQGSLANGRQKEQKINNSLTEIDGKIQKKKAQIRSLKSQSGNELALYGQHMPRVWQEINANKQNFTEMPRGPLGQYIKLKDKKWTSAVEGFIGRSTLQAFCVTNHQDFLMLNNIFSKVITSGRKPEIISSKFFHQVHNVSRHCVKPPQGYNSLQNILDISDPVVENCLIDSLRIETVLLLPNSEDAYRIMSKAANVPRNCSRAITPTGDMFYPDPDYKTYSGNNKPASLLQVSTDDALRQLENDLIELQNEMTQIVALLKETKNGKKEQENILRSHENHVLKLRTAKVKKQEQLRSLRLKMEPDTHNTDVLVQELEELKKIVSSAELQERQLVDECEKLKLEVDEAKQAMMKFRESIAQIESRVAPLESEVNKENSKLLEMRADSSTYANELTKKKKDITEMEKRLKEQDSKLETEYEKIEEMGECINNPREQRVIEREHKEVESIIRGINAQNEDPEYITEMYRVCKGRYDDLNEILTCLKVMHIDVNDSIEMRMTLYKKLMKKVDHHIKRMFDVVLELRNYNGTLHIDHEKKELVIHVQTKTNQSRSGDTRCLSGGERSYSTVAFIMALWNCVKFPFYFMDEFDVFMDKVNRKTIMDLLRRHADEHPEYQFVFLTPQDISSIVAGPKLTIHRMRDPERNGQ